MGNIIQWAIVGLATVGVTGFIVGKLKKVITEFSAKIRKDIKSQIDLKLKDPEFREMAYKAIIYAQKTFGDLTGAQKLSKAISFAQKIIPGTLDDAIVEGVIQQIYEEIMKPIKEEK
jgi:hypothetical protein